MLFKKKKNKKTRIEKAPTELAIEIDAPTIIREAKLKPNTCDICGTVFQAEPRHLFTNGLILVYDAPKHHVRCPICNNICEAEFKEVEDSNGIRRRRRTNDQT